MSGVACSVVIATRGAALSIGRTIAALLSQSLSRTDYEVIVVDNNESSADSSSLAHATDGLDVRLVHEHTRGAASARNAGVLAATGDVVVFVDDDIEANPEFLEAHLAAHRDGATVAVGVITEHNSHSAWFRRYLTERRVVNREPDPRRVDWRNFYGANTSVKRSSLLETGGFDPAFIRREDAELGYRLMKAGATFAFASGAVGRHHSAFGPLDHLHRSYWNGYYLGMLLAKHPELERYEKMQNYGWGRAVLAGAVALPLLLVGLVAYPVTRRPFHTGITALVLVQNARGFNALRRTATRM
jgi:glycosyltransferase involved in cell wall biosynthesis